MITSQSPSERGSCSAGFCSVLRRARRGGENLHQLTIGSLTVNTQEARVWKRGKRFLTALEYRLLLTFLNHPGQVLTRSQLLEGIWDVAGDFVNDNTLTVYIKRLRGSWRTTLRCPRSSKQYGAWAISWNGGRRRDTQPGTLLLFFGPGPGGGVVTGLVLCGPPRQCPPFCLGFCCLLPFPWGFSACATGRLPS